RVHARLSEDIVELECRMASIPPLVSFIVDLRDLDSLCSGEGAGHQGSARLLSYRVGAEVLEIRGSNQGFLAEEKQCAWR
ncbi:MAG: hypothetical protein ACYSUD_18455, partial [Planctomycetota bacterium]